MNLHIWDWVIVASATGFILYMTWLTKRYMHGVTDFLAANRCAGRYLICVATGSAGVAAISLVAMFEQHYESGFSGVFWTLTTAPILLFLYLTGWVTYRMRETGALTIAEFIERRYGRRLRVVLGIIAFVAGLLNYAIFPQITSNFIVAFFGFPQVIIVAGVEVPTNLIIIVGLLSLALLIIFRGGIIAVLVTDFIQGSIVNIGFVVIGIFLILHIQWDVITETLSIVEGGSARINPFSMDSSEIRNFTVSYFLMNAFLMLYSGRIWQGQQAYTAAARTPHEGLMAGIISEWRSALMMLGAGAIMPITVWVVMHNPQFGEIQNAVQNSLSGFGDQPQMQSQLVVPYALSEILPVGILGLLAVMILSLSVTTDNTFIHALGSILCQDVLMQFRKKPFEPHVHMRVLKWCAFAVAIFALFWSMFFTMGDFIFMYSNITMGIYASGAGAAIVGGLYWRRGTSQGAWTAIIMGSVLTGGGFALQTFWPSLQWFSIEQFPLNGMQMAFYAAATSMFSYIVVSLITQQSDKFNLEHMLHRDENDSAIRRANPVIEAFSKMKNFSRGDQFVYILRLAWGIGLTLVLIIGTILGRSGLWGDDEWLTYWRIHLIVIFTVGGIAMVWITIGGGINLKQLFNHLKNCRVDTEDDGWVKPQDINEEDKSTT